MFTIDTMAFIHKRKNANYIQMFKYSFQLISVTPENILESLCSRSSYLSVAVF